MNYQRTILQQAPLKTAKYNQWPSEERDGILYLRSPDGFSIAYLARGKAIELTWNRHGREGPQPDENLKQYVGRRLSRVGGAVGNEVRALVKILEDLAAARQA